MQIFIHTVKHYRNTWLIKQMYSGKEARRKPVFFSISLVTGGNQNQGNSEKQKTENQASLLD